MALVEVTREGHVATITLNRPQARNALSAELCEDLEVGAHGIEADPTTRAVVLRGAGDVFCAGADLAAVSGPGATDFLVAFERMLETIARLRTPTVAAIHGAALGGGLQLACVCDFRIATADAKLGIPAASLGIVVNFENVQRLVLLVGPGVAKRLLVAAETLTGEQAEGVALVTRSVAPGHLGDEVRYFAERLTNLAPLSVHAHKRSIQVAMDTLAIARSQHPELVEEIDRLVVDAYASQDLAEGVRALGEKRAPRFRGL